ncbi:MAG: hypothetical protein HRU07_05415 [Nitrosopumilus sp.]|nr:hypothetical protein [Nitrosopumilus sp.]NRA05585.1 hypothetical protein [Nitrosopumilus sp.]
MSPESNLSESSSESRFGGFSIPPNPSSLITYPEPSMIEINENPLPPPPVKAASANTFTPPTANFDVKLEYFQLEI